MMPFKGILLLFTTLARCWFTLPDAEITDKAQQEERKLHDSVTRISKYPKISKAISSQTNLPSKPGSNAPSSKTELFADLIFKPYRPLHLSATTQPPIYNAPQTTTPIAFDADLDKRKDLSAYAKTADPFSGMVINPHCIAVVPDPVFGNRRTVMEMKVTNTDIGPTKNPRAQVQTPMQYTEGQEVWAAFSVLFPKDFPDFLSWMTLAEFYGAPYKGTSPFLIGCRTNKIILQHNSQYKPLWEEKIRKGVWYDILYRTVLSKNSSTGEVQVYIRIQGEGPEWREVLKEKMATITKSNADGPQYHKICNYRSLEDNWQHLNKTGDVTLTRIFLANHRLGATRKQVEPAYLSIQPK